MTAPSRRAAAVLERLAGDIARHETARPETADADADAAEPSGADRAGPPGLPRGARRRLLLAVGAAAAAVTLGALVVLDRRPPPIEDRLPRAGDRPVSEVASASTAPPAEHGGTAPAGAGSPAATVVVHVAGAVASSGVVELPAGSRVVDAVRSAGGLAPSADTDRVNLAAVLADGQRVVVPAVGQEVPPEVFPSGASPSPAGAGGPPGPAAAVDLNTATEAELDALPGIGPATASAILAHRERNGPFASVESLIEVRGIGEAKLEALRDLVTVTG